MALPLLEQPCSPVADDAQGLGLELSRGACVRPWAVTPLLPTPRKRTAPKLAASAPGYSNPLQPRRSRPSSPSRLYGRLSIKDVPVAPRAAKPVLQLHFVNDALRQALREKLEPPLPSVEAVPVITRQPKSPTSPCKQTKRPQLQGERYKAASGVSEKAPTNADESSPVPALSPPPPPRYKFVEDYVYKEKRERLAMVGSPRLVWCRADSDADYDRLLPGEFFNHFQHNHELTTKVKLAQNLLQHTVATGANIDGFFPRCYDIMGRGEREDFVMDFRRSAALKIVLLHASLDAQQRQGTGAHSYLCNLDMLTWAKRVLQRWCQDLDPNHLDEEDCGEDPPLDENAWDSLILYSELTEAHLCTEKEGVAMQHPRRRHYRIGGGVLLYEHLQEQTGAATASRPPKVQAWSEFRNNQWGSAPAKMQESLGDLTLQLAKYNPQWDLQNSCVGRNVWIVKPGTNSKGSGVVCMSTLPELLHYCDMMPNRIIQRYIERPLMLFSGRKFDIRQWVLVRSVSPLRIFLFSDCYLRLCNEAYDLNDLRNRESHISNWQVNRHGKNIVNGAVASLGEFKKELFHITHSETFWEEKLWPQLCAIVVQTIRAAKDKLIPRHENFELFGFDLMVDDVMNMWLLEVNLSPGCEGRTEFLDKMMSRMVRRLVDVVVLGQELPDGEQPDWVKICDDSADHLSGTAKQSEAVRRTPRDADLTVHGHALQVPRCGRRAVGSRSEQRKKVGGQDQGAPIIVNEQQAQGAEPNDSRSLMEAVKEATDVNTRAHNALQGAEARASRELGPCLKLTVHDLSGTVVLGPRDVPLATAIRELGEMFDEEHPKVFLLAERHLRDDDLLSELELPDEVVLTSWRLSEIAVRTKAAALLIDTLRADWVEIRMNANPADVIELASQACVLVLCILHGEDVTAKEIGVSLFSGEAERTDFWLKKSMFPFLTEKIQAVVRTTRRWAEYRQHVTSEKFLQLLASVDLGLLADNVRDGGALVDELRTRMAIRHFTPETGGNASSSCGKLIQWLELVVRPLL